RQFDRQTAPIAGSVEVVLARRVLGRHFGRIRAIPILLHRRTPCLVRDVNCHMASRKSTETWPNGKIIFQPAREIVGTGIATLVRIRARARADEVDYNLMISCLMTYDGP